MKYDILLPFRDYLNTTFKNKLTAKKYYFATKKLLKGLYFDQLADLNPKPLKPQPEKKGSAKWDYDDELGSYWDGSKWIRSDILLRLSAIKTKGELSSAKNGLMHLETFCGERTELSPDTNFFTAESKKKFTMKSRSKRVIHIDSTKRKINALRDPKLKYAYRLMLVSGLRVSEASALTKGDISINNNKIVINVKNGKGGKSAQILCMDDPYLTVRLSDYLADRREGEKIFYSAAVMQQRANKLGIECHNLRRIAANTFRRQRLASGEGVYEARAQTSEFLRHSSFSTTKRYLMGHKFNRKLFIK